MLNSVLFVFDIDKTLLATSGAHMKAYRDAFGASCGLDIGIDEVEHHGRTELWIIPEILKLHGWTDKDIEKVLPDYFEALKVAFKERSKDEKLEILPGVVDLLEYLHEMKVILGVVSGNSRSIAELKLAKVNLLHFFDVSAFGDESKDRTDLMNSVKQRALQKKDTTIEKFVNIGDAPPDIIAGLNSGFIPIGVCTGKYSAEQLKSVGAVHVLNDLKEIDAISKIIEY